MTRDEGGRLSVRLGEMESAVAVLEAMDAPRRVTSRGLPDAQLATTYSLEEEKAGTRVTVTMTGFDSLPEDSRQDRLDLTGASWQKALENLKAHVGGTALPHPQASVAPLFGYWRQGKEKLAVERSIWIDAPRERVWQAITDPDQIGHWFSPGTRWRGTGPKAGGTLAVIDPETGADSFVQIIDVVDAPRRLDTFGFGMMLENLKAHLDGVSLPFPGGF
jgi:uncharacterized protein YndB with AHSA1/START domain